MSLGRGQSPVLYEAGPCMGGWVLYKWDGTCMGGTCTMRPTASWVLVTWDPLNRKTDTCENITFPRLHWRAVKIRENIESILKSKGWKVKGNSGSLQQDFKSIILELFFIQVSHSVATNEAARDIRPTHLWTETSVKQWYSLRWSTLNHLYLSRFAHHSGFCQIYLSSIYHQISTS